MPTWTPEVTSDTSGSTQEITVAVQNPVSGSEGTVTTTRIPNIIGSSDSVTYSEYEDLSALLLEDIADIATRPNPDIVLNATYRVTLDLSAVDISGAYLLLNLRKWASGHRNTNDEVTSTSLGSVLTEVTGSDKADFIIGTDSEDTLNGGGGNDRLVGGKGDDTLNGGDGDDLLIGGAAGDTLDGGDGTDTVSYAASDTAVNVDLSDNVTEGGGHAVADLLLSIENLTGSAHNDYITGDAGANILDGGAGDDRLTGGGGDDTFTGGAGDDIFILDTAVSGSDTITDFSTGSDKIRVDTVNGTETTLAQLGLAVADDGTDSFIYADDDGTSGYQAGSDTLYITLEGFTGWDNSTHLDVV